MTDMSYRSRKISFVNVPENNNIGKGNENDGNTGQLNDWAKLEELIELGLIKPTKRKHTYHKGY